MLSLVAVTLVPVRTEIEQSHIVLTLILVVLGGSAGGGRRLGLTLAVLSFVLIDYSFQPPYDSLTVSKTLDWLVLLAFLAAAFVATELLTRARAEAEQARLRTAEVTTLAHLGSETLRYANAVETLRAIAVLVRTTLEADWCGICSHSATAAGDTIVTAGARTFEDGAKVLMDAAAAGGPEFTALIAARSDGTLLRFSDDDADMDPKTPCSGFGVPLRVEGRLVGVLVVTARPDRALHLDVGRRRFLSALSYYAALGVERQHLASQAEEARVLREANRAKDEVLAAVSHDLRTPLATIKVLAQASRTLDDSSAALIEEEVDRLSRMVSDVLDLSRIRLGGLTMEYELNTAEDLVGAALQRVQGVLKGRHIRTLLDDTSPALAGRFDLVHSLRILGNLIDNALRFTQPDGSLDLETGRDGPWMVVRVSDRGPGVAPAETSRVFDAFYRPRGEAPDAGHAGLGLSIAKQLAELQGGSVSYTERDGGGAVFTLRLPAADWTTEPLMDE